MDAIFNRDENMTSEAEEAINFMCSEIHELNKTWWIDIETGKPLENINIGEKMMLIVSEIAEAMEGHRKNLLDEHLPERLMVEVELADAVIRIFDLCGYLKLDLGGALVEKLNYNKTREDHKIENRLKDHGKKY